MTTTAAINDAIRTIRDDSERISNAEPRDVSSIEPGEMCPQGDIGLMLVDALPRDAMPIDWPESQDMQLAPGDSQGSRHCIPAKYRQSVRMFRYSGGKLSDLCIEADAPFDLTHPEHADHTNYPAGAYTVHHQQNEQRQRVLD